MNLSVFHEFRVSKIFIHMSGMSRFSVKKFLSHSAECHRREPFCVSEVLCIEKFYGEEGWG